MFRLFRAKDDPGKSIPELENIINNNEKYEDDDYIHKRFIILVKHYHFMLLQNSNLYFIFRIVLLIAACLTSFTVALEAIVAPLKFIKLIALLLSLFVAILGVYLTTFNVQAKLGAYRSIQESLIAEFYKFHMGLDPYSPDGNSTNDRKTFATNVEQLIKNANKSWGGLNLAASQSGKQ